MQKAKAPEFDHRVFTDKNAIKDKVHTILDGKSSNLVAQDDSAELRGTFFDLKMTKESDIFHVEIGSLNCDRFLAVCRQKLWWVIPVWGSKSDEIPAETQFLLVHIDNKSKGDYKQEKYALILPLLSNNFRSCLESTRGRTYLRVESGSKQAKAQQLANILFISVSSDPYQLLERGFKAVADRMGTFAHRTTKKVPDSLNDFGWCTWDAFYSEVGGAGIMEGVEALSAGRTPPRVLIIDDGWQDTTHDEGAGSAQQRAVTKVPMWASLPLKIAVAWPVRVLHGLFKPLWYTFFPDGIRSWAVWRYYSSVVSIAPHSSFHVWLWGTLSTTIFKLSLLDTLTNSANTGDFTKRLRSSKASPRFLSTLEGGDFKTFVNTIKTEHNVKYVYCWHALLGYWGGVHPNHVACNQTLAVESTITKTSPMKGILKVEPQLKWDPLSLNGIGMPPIDKIDSLYDSMHSYLASCAVDGVKVDAQAMATMLGSERGGSLQTTSKFIKAMEKSVVKHFKGHCINCMCHPTECLYSYTDTAVARASDDFYPRDGGSHTTHIANVAYNSLFIGEIVQPDWDMFQSNHQVAALHAAARAVGGCAVYVSDHPGNHDFNILQRLVLPDGSVLRAELPGRPTRDCLFSDVTADGQSALKIWNRNKCNGVLGAFNVQGSTWDRAARRNWIHSWSTDTLHCQVRPTDVEGMLALAEKMGIKSNAARWAMLAMHWQANGMPKKTPRVHLLGSEEAVKVELAKKEVSTFTVSVVHAGRKSTGRLIDWAAFGIEDMFNPGGAILEEGVSERKEGEGQRWANLDAKLLVKGVGKLLIYCQMEPSGVLVDDEPSVFYYSEAEKFLRIPLEASANPSRRVSVRWE